MKYTYVLIGNFGSGKTEIAINMSLNASKSGRTALVDLDIINPYFRSTERKHLLSEHNITLHSPVFAMTGVEVPSLPPDIYSVFIDDHQTVIFDVGGDPAGAVALGQYKNNFDSLDHLEVLYVINSRRPFSADLQANLDMMNKIAIRSRLKITGLINNSNLSNVTTAEILEEGYDMVRSISVETGVPVKFTAGMPNIVTEFSNLAAKVGLSKDYIGELLPLSRYMHRDWDRFTEKGI